MPTVLGESGRWRVRASILLVLGGMAVSGMALTAGAIGAIAFFRRGSVQAYTFVALTVFLVAIAAGRAVSLMVIRRSSGPHPHVSPTSRSVDPAD